MDWGTLIWLFLVLSPTILHHLTHCDDSPQTEWSTSSSVCSRSILYPQLLQALEFCWDCLHLLYLPWVSHVVSCSSLCHQHLTHTWPIVLIQCLPDTRILCCDIHVEVSRWCPQRKYGKLLLLSDQIVILFSNHRWHPPKWEYPFRKPEQGKVNPWPSWS